LKVNSTAMTSELPIACSLSAGDLDERLAQMTGLGRDALLGAELAPGRARLRFAHAAGVRERLERIAAAEAECCAFLTTTVREEPGELVLAIAAPADAGPVLEELVDAFRRNQNNNS
jgi:hypothetical protein